MTHCVGSKTQATEFDFVRALLVRQPGECCGPAVVLAFSDRRLAVIEQSFQSEQAKALLYDGHLPEHTDRATFRLCAAHWMDLSSWCQVRAVQHAREDWHRQSAALLRSTCEALAWDIKEIANLLSWRRASLTDS